MSLHVDPSVAEAVGRRILERRGSEIIELVYFLEERNTLELLREFVSLHGDDQEKIVSFLKRLNRRDGPTLSVGRDGLTLRPGG
jgi:hypothetical protein